MDLSPETLSILAFFFLLLLVMLAWSYFDASDTDTF